VFFILSGAGLKKVFSEVVRLVKANAEALVGPGIAVRCVLVGYGDDIVYSS